jgi:RNA polymerase sigma-70 factor (ECF subfamily)
MSSNEDSDPAVSSPVFATTHWSVVLNAGRLDSPHAAEALAQLCRAYWHPLYAYARRHGHDVEAARDLTQEFFARLLEKNYVGAADKNRGRFRTFLLSAFEHFLAKEWRDARRQKRGGGQSMLSLHQESAEQAYQVEPMDELTPEKIFDRRWALRTIELALERLCGEYTASGRGELFEALKPLLTCEETGEKQAQLAERLGLSEGALRVAIHRLRQRYGESLREEIAQTVGCQEDVDEELRHLLEAVSGSP